MIANTIENRTQEKTPLGWGVVAIALGVFIVLQALGVIPTDGMNGPVWVGALGGLVFVLGGAAIVIQALAGAPASTGELPPSAPSWMRAAQYLAVLFVFGAFALIGTWVAFGPGEREFAMSLGGASGPAPGLVGRAAFGFGAVICWLCFAGALASGLRQLRTARRD